MIKHFFRAWIDPRPQFSAAVSPPCDTQLQSIRHLLCDNQIDEIWIGPDGLLNVRSQDRSMSSHDLGWSGDDVSEFIIYLSEQISVRLDPFHPYGGGVLRSYPWRWHASIPPLSPEGPRVALRRQRFEHLESSSFECENFKVEDLLNYITSGMSVLFFGATGSGKTSLMVRVLKDFFYHYRVGIAETVVEIPLMSPYWFRLTEVPQDTGHRGGVGFGRVVSELMRATPDFIVIGEIRGSEAAYLGELARSGHGGVLSTIHGGSFDAALTRLSTLAGGRVDDLPPIVGIHVWRSSGGAVHARLSEIKSQ